MLTKEMIFNDDTLNIFTDASITKLSDGETIGCFGAILIHGKDQIPIELYSDHVGIRRYSTNNDSELRGILLGVYMALRFRDSFKTINLFSDSMISIMGLKEWIFTWARNVDKNNGNMRASSGYVKNQELIERIIYTIINYNLYINLYHQHGHININKPSDIDKATKTFIRLNNVTPTKDLMTDLSIYNDRIDNLTRDTLIDYVNSGYDKLFKANNIQNLIRYDMNIFKSSHYKKLIGRK